MTLVYTMAFENHRAPCPEPSIKSPLFFCISSKACYLSSKGACWSYCTL